MKYLPLREDGSYPYLSYPYPNLILSRTLFYLMLSSLYYLFLISSLISVLPMIYILKIFNIFLVYFLSQVDAEPIS